MEKEVKIFEFQYGALWWAKKLSFYVDWERRAYRWHITPNP